jgi:hypothetical protein
MGEGERTHFVLVCHGYVSVGLEADKARSGPNLATAIVIIPWFINLKLHCHGIPLGRVVSVILNDTIWKINWPMAQLIGVNNDSPKYINQHRLAL